MSNINSDNNESTGKSATIARWLRLSHFDVIGMYILDNVEILGISIITIGLLTLGYKYCC